MKPSAYVPLLSACFALGTVACGGDRNLNSDLKGVSASAGAHDDGDGDDGADGNNDDGADPPSSTTGANADDEDDGGGPSGPALDVAHPGCDDGECPEGCFPPPHAPCDGEGNGLDHALGIGCPDEQPAEVSRSGNTAAVTVTNEFGNSAEWAAVEGERFVVLGTGLTASLLDPDPEETFLNCSDDLGDEYDPGATLPEPLRVEAVAGDCDDDPTLIGTGDCSSTVGEQFDQGGDANDYTEVRIDMTVPDDVSSISYSFAFMTSEWPVFVGGDYNDLFVGWLESEAWTGNISFDETGSPISVNASFLDHQDENEDMPEFEGTCMAGHAATKWLQSTAPVIAGEDIALVFAIFDMSDSIYDSFAFVDNVQFGCDGGLPETVPAG